MQEVTRSVVRIFLSKTIPIQLPAVQITLYV